MPLPELPRPGINQSVMPSERSSVNSIDTSVQVSPPYASSILAPDASDTPLTLTIDEAIRRGLLYNLGAISASSQRYSADASILGSKSALLPTITGSVSENVDRVNLAAQGFDSSSLPSIGQYFPSAVGPFHYYSALAQFSQSSFDMVAIRNLMSARETGRAADFNQRDVREQIALAVAAAYLHVLTQDARVTAATSQVKYAQAIYDQAVEQKAAGAKSSIEVNRSRVQLQARQQHLIAQLGETRKQKMVLARMIGLSSDREIQLAETFQSSTPTVPALDSLYSRAMARNDVKALEAQLRSAEESRRAASAERLPSVRLSGFFGEQGPNFQSGAAVYNGTVTLNVPIFNSGQTRSDVQQADSALQDRRAALAARQEDVRFEVRSAWIDLDTASEQLKVAESNKTLAEETLQQSIDRFKLGAADSVEVAQSQDEFSAADQDYINSLYSLRLAQISLARAIGTAEHDVPSILKGVRP
ncbi:MAG TPA: TolC family protein [Terracidiphilus sp.]|nr:TolC family protein [Terracidiphilus sp.]